MPADVYYDATFNSVYCGDCATLVTDLERMTFVELCRMWYNEKPGRLLCGHCEKNLSEATP